LYDLELEFAMFEIPQNWKSILDILIGGDIAWQTPGQIAKASGRDLEPTTDLLCEMDVAGWVEVWDGDVEPLVTLTPLAAERLGVVIAEFGVRLKPRWVPAGDPPPSPPKSTDVHYTDRQAHDDAFLDPFDFPDIAAEKSERVERRTAALRKVRDRVTHIDDLPTPVHLQGQGLTPWPGPAEVDARPCCPACGDRPLAPHVYCLCCNRWGLDDLLAVLWERQDEEPPPQQPDRMKGLLTDALRAGAAAFKASPGQFDQVRRHGMAKKKARRGSVQAHVRRQNPVT
jgi:hypothetical protein